MEDLLLLGSEKNTVSVPVCVCAYVCACRRYKYKKKICMLINIF